MSFEFDCASKSSLSVSVRRQMHSVILVVLMGLIDKRNVLKDALTLSRLAEWTAARVAKEVVAY